MKKIGKSRHQNKKPKWTIIDSLRLEIKKVSNMHLLYSVYFKFVFESISKLIISYTLQKTLLYLHNIENEEVKILKKIKISNYWQIL